MNLKKVKTTLRSALETGIVEGTSRIIHGTELGCQDPFVKFEQFIVTKPEGYVDHPHRGVDTVTYIWKGVMVDEDCFGNVGRLDPGDVQWLTTGRGVAHARIPISEEPVVGFQLWLNLPRRDKMAAPKYQDIKASEVPKCHRGGVSVAVICGETIDLKSKVSTKTPVLFLDIIMQPETQHIQPVPSGWTTVIYTISGRLQVGADQKVATHHAVLFGDGDCVRVENQGSEVCHFVLMAGEPIGEPVIHCGQFVMTTEEEINQAFQDYENGTNGFEQAKNWKSKISEFVNM